MSLPKFHSRCVLPGGIISVDDVLYRVPAELEGKTIIVDTERLEYRPATTDFEDVPPTMRELRLGLRTAKELSDRRGAHESPAAA